MNKLDRNIYIKIAPSQPNNTYVEFVKEFNNVIVINDRNVTSEMYCLHPNIDIIVSDESSAVVNSIFSGNDKIIYFLAKEINEIGKYYSDPNNLIDYLTDKKIIQLTKVDELENRIAKNLDKKPTYIEDDNFDIFKTFDHILNE